MFSRRIFYKIITADWTMDIFSAMGKDGDDADVVQWSFKSQVNVTRLTERDRYRLKRCPYVPASTRAAGQKHSLTFKQGTELH